VQAHHRVVARCEVEVGAAALDELRQHEVEVEVAGGDTRLRGGAVVGAVLGVAAGDLGRHRHRGRRLDLRLGLRVRDRLGLRVRLRDRLGLVLRLVLRHLRRGHGRRGRGVRDGVRRRLRGRGVRGCDRRRDRQRVRQARRGGRGRAAHLGGRLGVLLPDLLVLLRVDRVRGGRRAVRRQAGGLLLADLEGVPLGHVRLHPGARCCRLLAAGGHESSS
jgi:hypothetical protein